MAWITTPLVTTSSILDYNTCTLVDLHGLIESRSGAPVAGPDDLQSCIEALKDLVVDSSDTRSCIKVLKDLDDTARFRFLDLPKELRLKVYEEVLDYSHEGDNTWQSVSPQILATNKQINDEASDILRQSLRSTTLIHINAPDHLADSSHCPTLRLGLSPSTKIDETIGASQVATGYPINQVQAPRVVMVVSSYKKAFEHLCSLPTLIERSGCSRILLKIAHGSFEGDHRVQNCPFSTEEVVTSLQLSTSATSVTIIIQGQDCKHLEWLRAEMASTHFAALLAVEQEMSKMIDLVERAGLMTAWVTTQRSVFRRMAPKPSYEDYAYTRNRPILDLDRTVSTRAIDDAQLTLASGEWQQLKAEAESILTASGPAAAE